MADAMITRSDKEYQALAWRLRSAIRKAEIQQVEQHGGDYGPCGFAYVVVTDKQAAKDLCRLSPQFKKQPGGGAEVMVRCKNWQSVDAAEQVAKAMAAEFERSGIAAHTYGRMD